MSKKRRTFSAAFKAKVAMEALKEQEPINRIASRYKVLPTQVSAWKSHLLKRLPESFESENKRARARRRIGRSLRHVCFKRSGDWKWSWTG